MIKDGFILRHGEINEMNPQISAQSGDLKVRSFHAAASALSRVRAQEVILTSSGLINHMGVSINGVPQ